MTFVTNLGEEQHIWPVLNQMRERAIAAHRASVIAMSQAAEHQGVTEEQLSAELEDVMRLAELPVPPRLTLARSSPPVFRAATRR